MPKAKASRDLPAIFPDPDHDHDRCSTDAMAVAEVLCLERGQRLTPIRRKVLAALLGSHKPLGAYEIIDRLAPKGPRPAPITAYRALEFLRENGLVIASVRAPSPVCTITPPASSWYSDLRALRRRRPLGRRHRDMTAAPAPPASRRNRR
jgi:hypothetical protein